MVKNSVYPRYENGDFVEMIKSTSEYFKGLAVNKIF